MRLLAAWRALGSASFGMDRDSTVWTTGFSRKKAAGTIAAVGITVSLLIQGIVGEWMDVVSIYINPLGAILAAVMFFWVFGSDYVRAELQKGRSKPIGPWLEPMTKYVFVGITILVYVAGVLLGGIG